jgi:hypothetical protein
MTRRPIIGYEGYYWIDKDGRVTNSSGHEIKPFDVSGGKAVGLYKLGQRDIILLKDLKPQGGLYEDS